MRHKISFPVLSGQLPVNSNYRGCNTKLSCHPERSQAKSEAIGSAESKDPYSSSLMPAAAGSSHDESAILFLFLLRRCLFRCRFLRVRLRHVLLSRLPRTRRAFHFLAPLVRLLHLFFF